MDENKIEATVIFFNKPSLSGDVYTKEVFQKAIERMGNKPIWLTKTISETGVPINLKDVAGLTSEIRISDEGAVAEFAINEPHYISELKEMLESGKAAIRPFGFGIIGENKVIENYDLIGFSIVKR